MKSALIVPPQARTHSNISVEHVRPGNQNVDCQQTAKRVPGENAVMRRTVAFLDFGHEFSLDEIEEMICSAAGRILFLAGSILRLRMTRRQVAGPISVGDSHHDE